MPRKTSAHELEQLRQRAAAERVKAREVESRLKAAEETVDQARTQVVEALATDDATAVATARKNGEQAGAQVRDLHEQVVAAGLRVLRAQHAVDAFEREHAPRLLDEQVGDAERITRHLNSAVNDALQLHRALVAARQEMDRTISAGGGEPRADGAAPVHEWEKALNELGRVVAQHPQLDTPRPRWLGRAASEERDRIHQSLQSQRIGATT